MPKAKPKTILIVDDEERFEETLRKKVESIKGLASSFDVEVLQPSHLEGELKELEERRESARNGSSGAACSDSKFDKAAVLLVDYDLVRLPDTPSLTGETVAYLARCYSNCGIIVGLNQYCGRDQNVFDLTLRGHPESFADLNIGSQQVGNHGLWLGSGSGFRPWSWPVLSKAVQAFERRADELVAQLESPILEYLGFPSHVVQSMPRSMLEFLSRSDSPEKGTFRDFVKESGQGLYPKDRAPSDQMVARIAAARIVKWLERVVLPGQDILVDAPHLVSRFPSLLKGQRETWSTTAGFAPKSGTGVAYKKLEQFRFQRKDWLSRQAWFWHDLSACEEIDEVREPWSAQHPDWVFCEDVSRFVPLKHCREFIADLPSPFVRRFVQRKGKTDYRPAVRFSL